MNKLFCLLSGIACFAMCSSCICQVQTAEVISLSGKDCEGVIVPGWGKCAPELSNADGKTYVKGIRTRLERVDYELAWYQCPSTREQYRPAAGAAQQVVYAELKNGSLIDSHWLETLPPNAEPGASGPVTYVAYKVYTSQFDPVESLKPMEGNDDYWYTEPLSWMAFVLVDVPGSVVGSVLAGIYTLLSPDEAFDTQYDDWGYLPTPVKK